MVGDYGGKTLPEHFCIATELVFQLPVLVLVAAVDAAVNTVHTRGWLIALGVDRATEWRAGLKVERRGGCRYRMHRGAGEK